MKTGTYMETITTRYAGFAHRAEELSAYGKTVGIFIIALQSGEVVHHAPEDVHAFEQWLQQHHIRNIEQDWLGQKSSYCIVIFF